MQFRAQPSDPEPSNRIRIMDIDDNLRDIVLSDRWLTQKSQKQLEKDQDLLLRARWHFLAWMLTKGKNPAQNKPLATSTAENYCERLDQLQRLVWQKTGEKVFKLTHEHAERITDWLINDVLVKQNGEPYESGRKEQDALMKYFTWLADQWDGEKWSPAPDRRLTDGEYNRPDEFTLKERYRLRETAHEYRTHPDPADVGPERRDEINAVLAQRIGKRKEAVTTNDWEHENNGMKIPSLIGVTLEAGLIPIEVERLEVGWVNVEEGWIQIPQEDAAKDRDQNKLPLSAETTDVLGTWLSERDQYDKYDDTDHLWLNNVGNPYTSAPLNNILSDLIEIADIDSRDRMIRWYSFRHSLGDYMESIGNRKEVKTQLRHATIESSEPYTDASTEQRRYTLEKLIEIECAANKKDLDETNTDDYEELFEILL